MKFFKQSIFALAVTLLTITSYASINTDYPNSQTLEEMKKLKDHYSLPSLSLAIGIEGKIVFSEAIGLANIEKKQKAHTQTQYSVGSLAKPMTGLVLAKLVDSEKINLDSKVSQYVKNLDYPHSFSIRQLASHIAGIPHSTPERDKTEFVNTRDHKSPYDAFHVFSSHPLLFKPGTEFKYSSSGYILLSAVIEEAARMNYVDFIHQTLFSKYQMTNTELDTSFAGKDYEASYYAEYQSDGTYLPSSKKRDRSFLFGGGGFISTPSDLINMSQATFDEDFLSDNMKQALSTPIKLENGEINPQKYSLGWRVGTVQLDENTEQTWTSLHHGGVTNKAATAYLLVVPECKAAIAFATNYVPNKFWQLRPPMATILKQYIQADRCEKAKHI